MISRTDEIKNIMRKLRDSKNESVERDVTENKAVETTESSKCDESLVHTVNEEDDAVDTENSTSETDLVLARLEDILARFEKVIAAAGGEEEPAEDEEPAEEEPAEEPAEDEEPAEEEPAEEEPAEEEQAEESYTRSLEDRIAALERRFTESRRRSLVKRFRD